MKTTSVLLLLHFPSESDFTWFLSVTGVESIEVPLHTNFTFRPFTKEFQTKVAPRLGRTKPEQNLYSETQPECYLINRYPLDLRNAVRDGASLPRCISLAIFGTEKHHLLRNAVVDFVIDNHSPVWTRDTREEFWIGNERDAEKNKWRGVTISLRTGGQGHPTPIPTPNPTP